MFTFHIRILADSFTESNLWFGKFDVYFVALFQFADYNIKMLISHSVKERLSVGRIIYNTERLVFTCHFCKCLCNLVFITFLNRFVSLIGIRGRNYSFRIKDRTCLGLQGCHLSVRLRVLQWRQYHLHEVPELREVWNLPEHIIY